MIKHINGWWLALTLAWVGITVWDIVRGKGAFDIGIDVALVAINAAWTLYAAARHAQRHREAAEFVRSFHKALDEEGPRTIIVPPAPPVGKRDWLTKGYEPVETPTEENGHA